ncbi:uncharacterized protein LOC116853679 isoform X2 [Odontomachus brunneus]|uniref:uncharacterized protein LOC116853679 isoform X2 n=1 Tax=Odontomachus brunneus TaxID=486640 RepID=UPI0013F26B56|nr:uncharacterized protein LOC116853679 isoform X2 [Odontomachus brunneus]
MRNNTSKMENEDIEQLRELKERLLQQALKLRDKLKNQEEKGNQSSINLDILSSDDENEKLSESLSATYEAKLCEISGQVTGIVFKSVNKKWLHDNIYLYTAKVETKAVSFNLELKVFIKGSDDFKIKNIVCYFINVDDCYILEISPWFKKITRTNNFSLLMSALSDYNDYSIFRSNILYSLESERYTKIEQNTEENGGVLVYVHPPADTRKNYLIFHWSMKFLELTWHIEHFFTVKSTHIGVQFSEENRLLLKEFCKIGLTKDGLVDLWDKLCTAIETYHARA